MANRSDFKGLSSKPLNPPQGVMMMPPYAPSGLQALYSACRHIYPDQPNPLQVTAMVKFWLGGPDPLDYISMYSNPGDYRRGIPPHWHYISFGLSDLHGDGRVHECTGPDGPSGFGFELTFRLRQEVGESSPPTWPAALLQALARYVFQSENKICVGDHIPWHMSLDGSESRIQHMMMSQDCQLQPIVSPFGTVNFIQVVGVCAEEMKTAQHWNGPGLLDLIRTIPVAGGSWLITDMRRGETIFDIDPQLQDRVDQGIATDGSNLSGVSGKCSWEDSSDPMTRRCSLGSDVEDDKENSLEDGGFQQLSSRATEQIKATLKKGLYDSLPILPPINTQEKHSARKESFDSTASTEVATSEVLRTRTFDAIHIKLNCQLGAMLPLALKGRLKHGRHFTFKSDLTDSAITLVSTSVVGSIATEQTPFAAHGHWLQILLSDDFIEELLDDLSEMTEQQSVTMPRMYTWKGRQLTITIMPD